jgi:hypothetical protein
MPPPATRGAWLRGQTRARATQSGAYAGCLAYAGVLAYWRVCWLLRLVVCSWHLGRRPARREATARPVCCWHLPTTQPHASARPAWAAPAGLPDQHRALDGRGAAGRRGGGQGGGQRRRRRGRGVDGANGHAGWHIGQPRGRAVRAAAVPRQQMRLVGVKQGGAPVRWSGERGRGRQGSECVARGGWIVMHFSDHGLPERACLGAGCDALAAAASVRAWTFRYSWSACTGPAPLCAGLQARAEEGQGRKG